MSWCDWKYCWSGMVVRVLRVLLCAFTYGWEMVVIAFHLVWLGRTIWRLSKSDCSSRISANYTNGSLVVKHLSRLEIKKLVRKLANLSTTQLSESNICFWNILENFRDTCHFTFLRGSFSLNLKVKSIILAVCKIGACEETFNFPRQSFHQNNLPID